MTRDFDGSVKIVAEAIDKWLPNLNRSAAVTENAAANILLALDAAGRPTRAALDVMAERRRQIEVEGWTPEHDDEHYLGEMACAAAAYAIVSALSDAMRASVSGSSNSIQNNSILRLIWPTSWSRWWKPKDRRRDLVRAGALILAEIERIDRAAAKAEAA